MAPAAGGFDEGIGNLQRFVSQLAEALTELHADRGRLGLHAEALERLEDEAGQQLDMLQDELQRRDAAVAAAHGALVDELEETGRLAAAAGGERLEAAQQRMGSLGQELERALQAAARRVEEGASALASSGFDPSASTVEAQASGAQEQQDGLEDALGALQDALDQARDGTEAAGTTAEGALSGLAGEAAARQQEAAEVGALAAYATEGYMDGLRSAVESVEETLGNLYSAWSGAGVDAAAALDGEASQLLSERRDQFEGEAGKVLDLASSSEEAGALLAALREVKPALELGVAVAERTEDLVPELNKAGRQVDVIDRLLDEMRP